MRSRHTYRCSRRTGPSSGGRHQRTRQGSGRGNALLVRELLKLEADHPELASTDSPTSQVGAAPLSATFAPVIHRVPMTSLDNAMDETELAQWGDRVSRG